MTRYQFSPEESTVWIDARSSLHPIHSESKGVTGWIELSLNSGGGIDAAASATGSLEMPISALTSGNPLYDREMARRVEARRFPTITGKLRSVAPSGTEGRYTAEGEVTFRGVTRLVRDELAISPAEDGTVVIEGEHVFELPDFGMQPPRIMMLKVYPDVRVRIRLAGKEVGDVPRNPR